MKVFSPEDVTPMAELAALTLTSEETIRFAQEFSRIFEYFDQLAALELEELAEPSEADVHGIFREDVVIRSSISLESFSPYLKGGAFQVPQIVDAG